MAARTLEQVVTCKSLPSLPTVAIQVLSLTSDHNVKMGEIAAAIQNDPALAARILRTVNSSYYGLSQPCPSITRAMTYLGLSTVKSLVLGFSLVDWTRNGPNDFDLVSFWRRSVYAAAATRRIATATRACDPEEAFVAALMQDLGMLAIHTSLGDQYNRLIAGSVPPNDHRSLLYTEQRELGFHHAETGARLGERWRLPGQMVEAIRHHHDPAPHPSALVKSVVLGCQAALIIAGANAVEVAVEKARFDQIAGDWFRINPLEARALLASLSEDARELASLFQVDAGSIADVDELLLQAEEASIQHQLGMLREADQLRHSNQELTWQAQTDSLTRVGNRKHFDESIQSAFATARSSGSTLGVIMIDADRFKLINDTYGHPAGDMVLMELARRIAECVGSAGTVCRYGGEEFVVLLRGETLRGATTLAEAIRSAVHSSPFDLTSVSSTMSALDVTVSLGAAVLDEHSLATLTSPQMLVLAADKAVYAAKNSGRNCVRVFTPRSVRAA